MTTLSTYAKIAQNVYNVPDSAALLANLPDWGVQGGSGTVHGSGFKGCIYIKSDEIVVAFKGTGGGRFVQDVMADAKLAIGIVPREASAAKNLFKVALTAFGTKLPITVVGHSLGGGLAQMVGYWYKPRFVTFNAPPMGGCIQKSKINVFKPQQMARGWSASTKSGADGHNFRIKGDIVSSRRTSTLGHYGTVTTFAAPGVGVADAHFMKTVRDYLDRSSDGLIDPFA